MKIKNNEISPYIFLWSSIIGYFFFNKEMIIVWILLGIIGAICICLKNIHISNSQDRIKCFILDIIVSIFICLMFIILDKSNIIALSIALFIIFIYLNYLKK